MIQQAHAEVVQGRSWIDSYRRLAGRQHRLDFAGHRQTIRRTPAIQGFDSKTITTQVQLPGRPIVYRQCPHAIEALEALDAPMTPGQQNDLRIGTGAENGAQSLQLTAQFTVVVNRTVEHQRGARQRVDHRLGRCRIGIENGKTPMPQQQLPTPSLMYAFAVRPAMCQTVQCSTHCPHARRPGPTRQHYQTTHRQLPYSPNIRVDKRHAPRKATQHPNNNHHQVLRLQTVVLLKPSYN